MSPRILRCLLWLIIGLACASQAHADPDAAQDIQTALRDWMSAFNARRVDVVCNLYSKDLRYDYHGFPERGFDDMCTQLREVLSDSTKQFSYALDTNDIFVSGDLAVVRVVWTLRIRTPDTKQEETSREHGMDVFHRQPDGAWKIVRFLAYETLGGCPAD